MSNYGTWPGRYPATVRSYDATRRLVRVEIPGLTDGGDEFPEAQIEYPIGEKSRSTEIEILPGDTIWVAFEAGDPRYPIVTGYRNPEAGNSAGVRAFHHANITLHADGTLTLKADQIKIEGAVEISGNSLTHNSKAIGADHSHSGVQPGAGNSGPPA